jgi:DNA topoisomerase-2
MHLFDADGNIKKYESPQEIIEDWYSKRKELYVKRKEHDLAVMKRMIHEMSDKIKFMEKVMSDVIKVFRVPRADIEQQCNAHGLKKRGVTKSYKYLIDIPLGDFTQEKINELQTKYTTLRQQHAQLEKSTINELWEHDLSQLKFT